MGYKRIVTFKIDERLLREFDKYAYAEFGSRPRAILFLIQIYLESRKPSSLTDRLRLYKERVELETYRTQRRAKRVVRKLKAIVKR